MSWELLNLLRTIATTIVVWIHASYSWWFATNNNLSISAIDFEIFVCTFINQAGRFAIPLFVIISGIGLTKADRQRTFQLWNFVRKRCLKILPAYILFTIINLIIRSDFRSANLFDKLDRFLRILIDGSADYHLYFLLIILKCYIFYPLLRLIKFSPQLLKILSLCSFSLLFVYWLKPLLNQLGVRSPELVPLDPIVFWLPYFLIGIWIAREPKWFEHLVKKLTTIQWGAIWAIAATLTVGEFYISASILGSAALAGHCYRPTVFLLTLTFLLWAMSWEPWLGAKLPALSKFRLDNILATFSGASFTTFLIHTHLLRLLTPLEFLGGVPYLIITAIGSWIFGILIWKTVRHLEHKLISIIQK